MAKATITITDKPDEDGSIDMIIEFDPPLQNDDDATMTTAQRVVCECFKAISYLAKEQ